MDTSIAQATHLEESHGYENKKLVKKIKANELEHNQMGSATWIATNQQCSNLNFISSSNPKANFCLSYSSFSMHLMPLLTHPHTQMQV
jgi:hypothetical protein